MIAHPNPNRPKLKFDGFELKEVKDEDPLAESKKNKAQARKEKMLQEEMGAKKSLYTIHKQV